MTDEAQAQLQAQEPQSRKGKILQVLKENIHFHFDSTLKKRSEFSGSSSLCNFFRSFKRANLNFYSKEQ